MHWDEALGSLLWVVFSVAVIIGLAYWTTRYVARYGVPGGFQAGRRMAVLAQLTLGRDQKLVVAQVGDRYFLLGVTAGQISQLAEFTAEEAALWQTPAGSAPSFREALQERLRQRERR